MPTKNMIKFQKLVEIDKSVFKELRLNETHELESFIASDGNAYIPVQLVALSARINQKDGEIRYGISVALQIRAKTKQKIQFTQCCKIEDSSGNFQRMLFFSTDAHKPEFVRTAIGNTRHHRWTFAYLDENQSLNLFTKNGKIRLMLEIHFTSESFDLHAALQKDIIENSVTMGEVVESLYGDIENGDKFNLTDYTWRSFDNQRVKCHRMILAKRTNLFAARDPDQSEVGISQLLWDKTETKFECSESVLKELRYFIYHDRLSLTFDWIHLKEILELARHLQIPKLTLMCEEEIILDIKIAIGVDGIKSDGLFELLEIAQEFKLEYAWNQAVLELSRYPQLIFDPSYAYVSEKLRAELRSVFDVEKRASRVY